MPEALISAPSQKEFARPASGSELEHGEVLTGQVQDASGRAPAAGVRLRGEPFGPPGERGAMTVDPGPGPGRRALRRRPSHGLCISECDAYALELARMTRSAWSRQPDLCMLQDSIDHADDVRLVRRAEIGEPEAVRELLRRLCCVPVILSARNRRLGSPLDEVLLQDVAQDVLVAVWKRLDRFGGESTLEAWTYRFCVHKHLAAVRNRGRRIRIEAVHSPTLDSRRAPELERESDQELVQLALEALESDLLRVVRLKLFDGLTFEEIGRRLAVSPNTVKTRYYRALGRLREFLASRGRGLA